MAAKRIPELPTLTGAGSVADDLFIVYDADLGMTKKITRAELALALVSDPGGPELPTLGTMAEQDADAVAITGGTITGITDLAVADGGTGASTAGPARSNLGAAASGANADITSLTGLTTPLSVGQGGTGATNAGGARTNISAASSGANSDITSLSGLTTPLTIAQGGTGANSAAAALAALGALSIAASTLSANGYVKFSNGLHLMWGSANLPANTAGTAVTFPVGVSLSVFSRVVGSGGVFTNEDRNTPFVLSCSTTGFVADNNKPDIVTFFWIGVGI